LSDNLDAAGTFDLSLTGVADTDWVVVAANGGADIDYNGDGVVDPAPTANCGTLHALAKAGDWRSRHLRVTPLTELAWRFAEKLVPAVSSEELAIRLADLARYLIKTDIDGSGAVDWYDILAFDPADPAHRAKLATSYDWLSNVDDGGNSIISALLAGNEAQMLACMDETYTWLMTRFPAPDSRYNSVKLSLSVFGPGSASSGAPSNLSVDATLETPLYEDHIYLPRNESTQVTFTAVAGAGANILSWSGCDTVTADLGQCTVALDRSRSVVANFGNDTTTLKGTVHDLSRTTNTLDVDTVSVLIPDDMTDMIAEMAAAAAGDFVVGDDGGGFLRRIIAITQVNATNYQLATVDANLEEVIAQGTGHLLKQMENSDLEGYAAPAQAAQGATVSPQAFTGIEGVRLIPSADPADRTFTITLGEPLQATGGPEVSVNSLSNTTTGTVTLYDDGQGGTLVASGAITMDISLDTGFDYRLPGGLQSFKFITVVDAEESVELTASTQLLNFNAKKNIGTLRFSPIVFAIGPVPVWVTPSVDIYLFANGKVGAQVTTGIAFSQRVEGGMLYNKDTGFSGHKDFSTDFSPTLPTAKINASLKGGMEASAALKIYDATGPAIPLEAYLQVKGSATTEVGGTCNDVVVKFLAGAGARFKWDLNVSSKLGQLLHLDSLENKTNMNIYAREWPIKEWMLTCPTSQGSHLQVEGKAITGTIVQGDATGLATTLTVKNTGDATLSWNTANIPPEALVSPASGELAPGGQELVQMSLATAGLPAGRYLRQIRFYNQASVGTGLPDDQFGNTYKNIDVAVQGAIADTPVITSATSSAVGTVTLDWSFAPSGAEPFVGFQIFATQTTANPETFQLVYTTNIYARQATIYGFTPGATYTFDMRAYSNTGNPGPFSNQIAVTITGTPPPPVGTVISAGQVWMDRNLGASQVATNTSDSLAYGDLYQWGRLADGHQIRTSSVTSTLSTSDVPGHGNFIMNGTTSPYDWRIPQNDNLWQGVSGTNNPCPSGFRLPTMTEWIIERNSWPTGTVGGSFHTLKLPMAGDRNPTDGNTRIGPGKYWSSTKDGIYVLILQVGLNYADQVIQVRSFGNSVRCLKD
jgi:uncharacterized protein (TIGR02145 family)